MPAGRLAPGGRALAAATAALLALGTTTGCTGDRAEDRLPGAPVTAEEADVLGRLLHRNHLRGGARFEAVAPYGGDVVLTLTGAVDFAGGRGSARLTAGSGTDRVLRSASIAFDGPDVLVGDVDGLAGALAADGASGAGWLRRPTTATGGSTAELLDLLVGVLLRLSAGAADPTGAFGDGDWTWQGQRSIDSRLCDLFAGPGGATVAVDATDGLLRQYVAPVPGGNWELTVTLTDHGPQDVELPGAELVAEAADHPEVAQRLGL